MKNERNGEITYRMFEKILRLNNYKNVRTKGSHKIYSNGTNTIAIPAGRKMMNRILAQRLIKENNLIV